MGMPFPGRHRDTDLRAAGLWILLSYKEAQCAFSKWWRKG
jgi:hypothetical protein